MITQFSDFRYVDKFRRYSRSNLKVVNNRAEFFKSLPFQILLKDPFQKLYSRYHGYFSSRRAVKFDEVIATSPKVIGVNVLNFKPKFKCSPLKFVGDPRPRLRCALTSLGESLSRVKIRWASTP